MSMQETVEISKSEYNARQILKRILIHDYDAGGVFTETTGSQGSGKTSVNLSFMKATIKNYPNEKIFFSNCYNAPLQFVKIGKPYYTIMVQKNKNITFHDRNNKLETIYPNITYFDGFNDLYGKAKNGKCNAVFFGDRFIWMDFIGWLRSVGEWSHVYIDEISEICPAFTKGKLWHRIGNFSMHLKEVRKCMLNVHGNTQSVSDIDHRIRTKVMVKIYLVGARADNVSRITQKAIDNLKENHITGNEAFIEYSGKFGKTVFGDIFKPNPNVQWEAKTNA